MNHGLTDILSFSTQLTRPIRFGVFDGMGGEAHGELASYIAAMELQDASGFSPAEDIMDVLYRANSKMCKEAHRRGGALIGTTAAILSIDSVYASVVNIGDSKVFRRRNGVMTQLSIDHTDKALMEQWGIQVRKPRLTQHLGIPPSEMIIEPAVWHDTICAGDRFLICTDGLTDMLSEDEISSVLAVMAPVDCVDTLIRRALQYGGKDNVTVIVVTVHDL